MCGLFLLLCYGNYFQHSEEGSNQTCLPQSPALCIFILISGGFLLTRSSRRQAHPYMLKFLSQFYPILPWLFLCGIIGFSRIKALRVAIITIFRKTRKYHLSCLKSFFTDVILSFRSTPPIC